MNALLGVSSAIKTSIGADVLDDKTDAAHQHEEDNDKMAKIMEVSWSSRPHLTQS